MFNRGVELQNSNCKIYLITPEKLEPEVFSDDLAAAIDAGNVACVQMRMKNTPPDQLARAIDILRPTVQERNVAFILNDDPNLAVKTGCDGVHIGQSDTSYKEARAIVGNKAIVGVTCLDSLDLAMQAAEQGADYVAFGAFFPSRTKLSKGHPSLNLIESWNTFTTVPCVAIGGIRQDNCEPLISAGADFLAVVSAVWDHPSGPVTAIKEFNNIIEISAK